MRNCNAGSADAEDDADVAMLEGALLRDPEASVVRKVRPWLVFTVLGALALATLTYVIVRSIPQDPRPIRDPLRLPRDAGSLYSLDPVRRISAAKAGGMTSEPWRLVGIDGRPHSLQIYYAIGGGCETGSGIRVHETRTSVTIEAASRTDHSADGCASLLKTGSGTVILRRALGDRALWHAPVEAQDVDLLGR